MLNDKAILIAEDDVYLALDLSMAVERSNGRVVGPVGTVAEALVLLEDEPVAAALLGSRLADRDVSPVAMALAEKGVPFVIHACTGLPAEVARTLPDSPLLIKPLHSEEILARLLNEMQGP